MADKKIVQLDDTQLDEIAAGAGGTGGSGGADDLYLVVCDECQRVLCRDMSKAEAEHVADEHNAGFSPRHTAEVLPNYYG